MKPLTYILILISLNCFGQDRFIQNDSLTTWLQSSKAPENKHMVAFLNETKDTVKVRSKKTIGQVYIYNDKSKFNWERPVYAKEIDIPLNDIPNGKHLLSIYSNNQYVLLWLNVYVEPKKQGEPNKKVIIKVPYNTTTTKIRRDTRFSDTIFIKQSREDYIRERDSLQGKRFDEKYKDE